MAEDIRLQGLQVNGQPFFAKSRALLLTGTACALVLKLSWTVRPATTPAHFIWLLSRLERCAALPQPWHWASRRADTHEPLLWRAWLVSPVGYGGDARGSLTTTVRLHLYYAPEHAAEETTPAFCPAGCNHDGTLAPVLDETTERAQPLTPAEEVIRQARGFQFTQWLTRIERP